MILLIIYFLFSAWGPTPYTKALSLVHPTFFLFHSFSFPRDRKTPDNEVQHSGPPFCLACLNGYYQPCRYV